MQREIFLESDSALRIIKSGKRKNVLNKSNNPLRFVDLFSGCGGLSAGIELCCRELSVRATCALAVDFDSASLEVFKDNIPHEPDAVINSSILDLFNPQANGALTKRERELKKKIGDVDILVAGPPCQGHSDLNNRTRRNDPRNSLYLVCIRAVKLFNPSLVLIENVPTVVHSKENVVEKTAERLRALGYFVNTHLVNFLSLGLPQTRKRHILVASKDEEFSASLITNDSRQTPAPRLRDYIYDLSSGEGLMYESGRISDANKGRIDFLFANGLYDLPDSMRPACHREKAHSYKSVYGRLHGDKPAQTITSGFGSMGQGRYVHPYARRTINAREAARIQGFPDSFSFDKVSKLTDLRQMIANAVPPQLSYILTKHYIQYFYHGKEKSKPGRRRVKAP
jgi:DNA (cytosine-5)-methyltransferase 1